MTTYTHFGGMHPASAALRNVLCSLGIKNPHTNADFTEAMVFGLAGGLGANYVLWEFRQHQLVFVTLGFSRHYPSHLHTITTAAERLGLTLQIDETGSKKRAALHLRNLLDSTLPGIMWMDRAHLPHHTLSAHLNGYFSHVVGVAGETDDNQLLIDDLAAQPFAVDLAMVEAGRGRIGSDKNRLLRVAALPEEIELPARLRESIWDCINGLWEGARSAGLAVLERWAHLLTNERNKKGWLNVFADGTGLYEALTWVHTGVKHYGTAGGALRSVYADFLQEAAAVLSNEALHDVADRYRNLAVQWAAFADAALPHDETRTLLQIWHSAYTQHDLETMHETHLQLETLRQRFFDAPPIDDVPALLAALQEQLHALHAAETAAVDALAAAVADN